MMLTFRFECQPKHGKFGARARKKKSAGRKADG